MSISKSFVALTAASLLSVTGLPAQDFSKATVKVVPVASGIYMLEGAGGNLGLSVGADDAFLVDDQYAPMTEKIRAAIATVTQKPVRFVVNTHWHGDHTGGNEAMATTGSIVFAHENVRRRMSTEQFMAVFKQRVPASAKSALPVVTFTNGLSFYLNGDTIRAEHAANAHTDGDAVITFVKANVVHTGDLFFNGAYPFIDASSGGSLAGTIAGVNRILARTNAATKIIPGHGPLAGRADLMRYRDMLVDVRRRVLPLAARNLTPAQVRAAKPLAMYDEKYGKGFMKPDVFLDIVLADLQRGQRPKR